MEFIDLVKNSHDLISLEDSKSRDSLINYSESLRSRIKSEEESSSDGRVDLILRSMSELVDLAVECDQCKKIYDNTYEDVTKVLKVRINLSKKEIESIFNIKPVGVYGVGLFLPVEGIMLNSSFRKSSGYDDSCNGVKGAEYNLSSIPKDVIDSHEFRLSIPAMGGLFVPKKCRLMNWISSYRAIQFLDFTL